MNHSTNTQDIEKIYDRYKNLLYGIAFAYLKNNADVEDVLQEFFLKRIYHAPIFQSEEHEKRWMIRITVNMSRNVLKSFWNQNTGGIDEDIISSLSQCNLTERESNLVEMVYRLPEKQRIVIYLYYFEGYSCKEIADILSKSESAVKMRLKKGRTQLKTMLDKE